LQAFIENPSKIFTSFSLVFSMTYNHSQQEYNLVQKIPIEIMPPSLNSSHRQGKPPTANTVRDRKMDKKEIRSIATASATLDKKSATIAARVFEVLKPAINSNDKATWKQATKEFAEALGFKSMNAYTEEKGGSLGQRVSEFTWAVEGVGFELESFDDYLAAKAEMLEAQKAAKAEEKEKAEMAEALEALQGQPIDELLEILNMIKTDIATRGADEQRSFAQYVRAYKG
jgi:hypothetical protein